MPSKFKTTTIALAVTGMIDCHAVGAAPAEAAPSGTGDLQSAVAIENPADSHMQFLAKRLETLHTALKLKPEQEPAWKQWSESIKAARPGRMEKHPDKETLSKLSVPQRLERMVTFAKEQLARLEQRLAETKMLYEVLTPEQRLTFDKDFNFWPHAGRAGRPSKHGRSLVGPRIGSQSNPG